MGSGVYVNPGQGPNQSSSSLKKSSPHLVVDLSECASSLNERPLKEIRQHLQASIKKSDRIKGIDIRAMSRRYFVFVSSQAHEDGLRVHLDDWLPKSFPKAQVQSTKFYPIRVDSVNASAVLDPTSGRVSPDVALSISEENGNLSVGRIGWLSQPGKKYGSMVLYLKEKSQADAMIARGFLEVGGESGTTQAWEDRGKTEQRCFNCQGQGHLARSCKEATVCGNCAQTGHHHRECLTLTPKCPKCGGNHRAKDHRSSTSGKALNPQPSPLHVMQPSRSTDVSSSLLRRDTLVSSNQGLAQSTMIINPISNGTLEPSKMGNAW